MPLQPRRSTARHRGVVALALGWAVLALAGRPAGGDPIKGRVMILVDTSGSMIGHFNNNNSCGGDGDASSLYTDLLQSKKNYYPGNLVSGKYDGPNSRIYGAKAAVTNVLNATGDIDFGLMRYAPAGVSKNHCQNSTWCCNFATPGCVTYNSYVQNGGKLNWEGACGPVANGKATDGGQILVAPGPTAARKILSWVDGVEDFRDDLTGNAINPELRANGSTPLAGSARTALAKWYQPLLDHNRQNPNCNPANDALCDPQIDCRPYALVMMTDGADTCDSDSVNAPTAAVKAIYDANGTNPVKIYTVGLALLNNDPAVGVLNAMAKAGGTTSGRFANDQASIEAALGDIVSASVKVEVCNGKDDNCNALVDEGFDKGAKCAVGVGACQRAGLKKCDANNDTQTACCVDDGKPDGACAALTPGAPGVEICNGLDDDCNGVIDDPPACQQPKCFPETCNGLDDDCDGVIDNHLIDVGRACGLDLGQCKPGVTTCENGQKQDVTQPGVTADVDDALVCVGEVKAGVEVCDGLDNDCDGVTDGMSQACYGGAPGTDGVGPCHGGTQACAAKAGAGAPAWGPCVGEQRPAVELCNGVDDDCDAKVDDVVGVETPCCPSGKCGTGVCAAGKLECSGGMLACAGGQGPTPELCNGVDDDCDAKVDNLPTLGFACVAPNGCPGALECDIQKQDEVCVAAQEDCSQNPCNDPRVGQPCGAGVGLPAPCSAGVWTCVNDQVVCKGGAGPQTEVCNCADDDCNGKVDDQATCPGGTTCIACACLGQCGGGEFPCPGGFECVKGGCTVDADCESGSACRNGRCDPGYCAPLSTCKPVCKVGWACVNNTCIDLCAKVTCPAGSVCDSGNCVRHDCATNPEMCSACTGGAGGQRCDGTQSPPACVTDLCCGVSCAASQICDELTGACVATCRNVTCREGEVCTAGKCTQPCGRECSSGQFCDPKTGECKNTEAACIGVVCHGGTFCCRGICGDDPCGKGVCAPSYRCRALPDCTTVCEPIPSAQLDTFTATGGGGLAIGCSAGGPRRAAASDLGTALLGLLLWALALSRRRLGATVRARGWRGARRPGSPEAF